ncbi:MAG: BlaI/MecI/CopY family transcriptional regulator [Tannerellaceae bacterium]
MNKLTIPEEEAMRFIWQIGPCVVRDILAKYSEPKPPYTTLASIIKNLEQKKYVKARHIGNTYEYRPLVDESEYKRTFMNGVVEDYFENSYKELVSFFAKDQKISADDLKEIIRMIEKGKE